MARELIITSRALRDIRRNADWMVANQTQQKADRWAHGITHALDQLTEHPERYPEADEALTANLNLRMMIHGRKPHVFRIVFTYDQSFVTVFRILHAAQSNLTEHDL